MGRAPRKRSGSRPTAKCSPNTERTQSPSRSGPDGLPCGRKTRGLLGRRWVMMEGGPLHVGKESNSIEARMRGEVESEHEYLNRYEPRLCACGCGEVVEGKRVYLDRAHKQRAFRNRRRNS